MSHWRRVVLMTQFLVVILFFIVFLTRVVGPMFNVGADLAIAESSNPFNGAWVFLQEVSYILIVPILILSVILYLVFGPAQEELQKERRRRGL